MLLINHASPIEKEFDYCKTTHPVIKVVYGITKKKKNTEETLAKIKSDYITA